MSGCCMSGCCILNVPPQLGHRHFNFARIEFEFELVIYDGCGYLGERLIPHGKSQWGVCLERSCLHMDDLKISILASLSVQRLEFTGL
jgi:hypothetical protein